MKILFTVLLSILIVFGLASAEIPKKITYQGILKYANAQIADDDTYNLTFRLYYNQTSVVPLCEETQSVNVINGIFNIFLSSIETLETNYLGLWFGNQINNESELSPRMELSSLPYA